MRKSIHGKLLLVSVSLLMSASAWAQGGNQVKPALGSLDLAVTFTPERAQIAPGQCGCFWFEGGGIDANVNLQKGISAVGSFTGEKASSVQPGVDVNKTTFLGGGRYTYSLWTSLGKSRQKSNVQIFGEGLFGGAHAFNSVFPSGSTVVSSANSFALETGGGIDVFFSRSFGVRLLEADYVRTTLPNAFSNAQNDLRLGAGVVYHVPAFHSQER
jgi:hypothetical protein